LRGLLKTNYHGRQQASKKDLLISKAAALQHFHDNNRTEAEKQASRELSAPTKQHKKRK